MPQLDGNNKSCSVKWAYVHAQATDVNNERKQDEFKHFYRHTCTCVYLHIVHDITRVYLHIVHDIDTVLHHV